MGEKPSKYTKEYWIFASPPKQFIKKKRIVEGGGLKTGKWLIFVNKGNVDEVWEKIKLATEKGLLGIGAKVSTAKPKPVDIRYKKDKHVICVYTYNWTDEKDVKRIRKELRKLGITDKIPYKADINTLKGRYAVKGHKRISKYYE